MCITEYDETKTMNMFKEEGRIEGREEGESKFGRLMDLLLGHGRLDDARKASTDPEYRNLLYREFQIA